MGAHAVRNASGSKRWMNCPGSIRDAEALARRGIKPSSSEFARLGTAAHGLCEVSVDSRNPPLNWIGGIVYLDENEDTHVIPPDPCPGDLALIQEHWVGYPIDENMANAVQLYYDTVLDDLEDMGPMAELHVERRFNLNWLIGYDFDDEAYAADPSYVSPNGIHVADTDQGEGVLLNADGTICYGPMFGTSDATILLHYDLLRVYDYKHGQGVVVEVEENSQEMYYALGVAYDADWAFEEMELVIIQPRAPHQDGSVRRWRTNKARLRLFEEELRAAALEVGNPDAITVAGEWCGFCPVAPYCKTLQQQAFQVAAIEFADLGEDQVLVSLSETSVHTDESDLQMRLDAIPLLDAFIKAVEGEAARRLRESPTGEAFGYKLVRKKSNRAFRKDLADEKGNQVDPINKLVDLGLPRELLFEEPKQKGPAKVEALRPPALMAKLKAEGVRAPAAWIKAQVAQLTYKPEGGIAIAPASDPRPAVDPSAAASADFEAVEDEV
jgi:hypothetical protein